MRKDQKSFTLLEVIIVIIIIGVLTSLALPRLMLAVERARAAEAISALSVWRGAIERCLLMNNEDYGFCTSSSFSQLGIDNPFDAPNSHFESGITYTSSGGSQFYVIAAKRNTRDLGLSDPGGPVDCGWWSTEPRPESQVALCFVGNVSGTMPSNTIRIVGSGFYKGL
jgi:prepilin-type N-terminal cleavage/methylation domain-containing protein